MQGQPPPKTKYDNHPPGWDPNSVHPPGSVPPPTGNGPTPPVPVPKWDSGSKTLAVYTDALDTFATNMLALQPPIQSVMNDLTDVSVQPGAFYDADKLRNTINGQNGDAGIKAAYGKVLSDIHKALQTLHDETITMSTKYKNFDDINTAGATNLESLFSGSTTQFGSSITDNKNGSPSGG
jgi:hypothetical protein